MIRNLVFEGGGVKGAAYVGALQALDERGILLGVTRVAGTSAGAITAMLVAFGASPKQVGEITAATPFGNFKDDQSGIFRDVWNLVRHYGFHRGEVLDKWLVDQAKRLTGNGNITFKELAPRGFRELRVMVTDLASQRAVVFSPATTPDAKVADAVRASAGIPLYFNAKMVGPQVLVDGGVSLNYPIHAFDDVEADPSETLGFRLDGEKFGKPHVIRGIKSYIQALLSFMLDTLNAAHVSSGDVKRTIFIDVLGVGATDFDLKPEKVAALVASGKKCTEKFLSEVKP